MDVTINTVVSDYQPATEGNNIQMKYCNQDFQELIQPIYLHINDEPRCQGVQQTTQKHL